MSDTEEKNIIDGVEYVIKKGKNIVYKEYMKTLKGKYLPDAMPKPADHIENNNKDVWYTPDRNLFNDLHAVGYVIEKEFYEDVLLAEAQTKGDDIIRYETNEYNELYYLSESGVVIFKRSDIATYLLEKFHALVVVSDRYMYIYNEDLGIYEIDYGDRFITELNAMFGDLMDIRESREIMSKVFHNSMNQHSDIEDIWQDTRYINFKNGIYNIETKELIPHSPDYYFITYIPVNYNPDARCPNIERLIGNVFTDDQLDDEYEWIGYCLTPGNKYKVFSVYIGTTDSGRSTYFNLVEELIGTKNKCAVDPQDLPKEFYIYELHNSMINICADIGSHKIKNFNLIKKLTGGDPIIANIKNKPLITFRNNCKLMWAANRMPGFDDSTSAAYNRLRQINCCKVIDKEDQKEFNFADYTTDEELSGLINLAIKGLDRLNARKDFVLPTIDERIDKHELYATSLFDWAEDSIIFDKDGDCKIFGKDLYESYMEWCKKYDMKILMSQTAFAKEFKNSFNKKYNRYYNVTIDGKQMRGCSGVMFVSDLEFDNEGDFYVSSE